MTHANQNSYVPAVNHPEFRQSFIEGIDLGEAGQYISKKEGSGKIGAEVLGIGGKTEGSISNEVVNRIKFRVRTWEK